MPCTRWAFLCLQTKVYSGLGAAHPVAVSIVCIFIMKKRLYSGAFEVQVKLDNLILRASSLHALTCP